MGKVDEILGAVVVTGLGLLAGGLLAAVLKAKSYTGPKCPVCYNELARGSNPCPHCHAPLIWG